jgi:hypothetical protein
MFYTVPKKVDFEQISESRRVPEQFSCQDRLVDPGRPMAKNKEEFRGMIRCQFIFGICVRAILAH